MPKLLRDGLVVQWPDTHLPEHHPKAVRNLVSFIGDQQPDLVIFTGDLVDMLSVARWTANTADENGQHLKREIDVAKRTLAHFRAWYEGRAVFLPGNHEERLAKWGRTRGRGVWGIEALTIGALLDFDGFGIEAPVGSTEASRAFRFAPDAVAIHGAAIHSKSGYSVTKELDRFGLSTSVVMGHTHRQGIVYRRGWGDKRLWGMEGGHLMNQAKADYITYGQADWHLGFGVITIDRGVSTPQVIPMRADGSFTFERMRYAA